jgi:putative effector of murein hydrolase LrgA (UPF0299 family)
MLIKVANKSQSWVNAQARGFARPFNRVAINMQDHPGAWLGAFTVVYFACTIAHALAKRLWFDELFTYYVSRLPGWGDRLALGSESPPLFYFLTRQSQRLIGWNSIGERMPEMVGFWLMCVCLFFFVRRRCPAIYGFLAMLIPVGTGAYYYAVEAKPYGLVLGMAGLSMLCWQCSAECSRRRLPLILLAFSIALGVNFHFYGAQIVIPLLAGETWRAFERRRIDWGMLSAVGLGLTPLAFLVPLARSTAGPWVALVRDSAVFWAKPRALSFVLFYFRLFGPQLPAFVISAIVMFLAYAVEIKHPCEKRSSCQGLVPHELVACLAYLMVPAAVLVVAWLKTGVFIDRYALSAVVGSTILMVFLVAMISAGRPAVPALFMAILVWFWISNTVSAQKHELDPLEEIGQSSALYPRDDTLPIVVADAVLFAQLAYYSPPELRSRLVYLTDPADAIRRADFLPELGLNSSRGIRPDRIEDYAPFLSRNREFWLYCHGVPRLEWLQSRLRDEGWTLSEEARKGSGVLIRVRWQNKADGSAVVHTPQAP